MLIIFVDDLTQIFVHIKKKILCYPTCHPPKFTAMTVTCLLLHSIVTTLYSYFGVIIRISSSFTRECWHRFSSFSAPYMVLYRLDY